MDNVTMNENDYKNIFNDIAERLFTMELIDNEEKIKLLNIISKDETIFKVS